jgi:N-acetylglucosamine transport system substrate-binding protein
MKNKVFRNILFAVLAAALGCGAFSACGKGPTGAPVGTLAVAFAECGYGREWLVSSLEAFKAENEGFAYSLEGDPGMTAKIGTRLDAKTDLADIYFGLQTNWQMWAIKDQLEDLTGLYETVIDGGKTMLQKMTPGLQEFGKVNGKYYAVPWNEGATGLVYNKKMFRENEWAVPETVQELIALCARIKTDTNGTVMPFSWGGQVAAYWNFPALAWWGQYEGIENINAFNEFKSASVFAQEGRLKALEAFETLVKDNSVPDAISKNHITSQMEFINGRAAMIPSGPWIKYEMKSSAAADFEYAMMQTPYIDAAHKVKMNYTASGDFIVVPKEATNKELAKRFLAFMARDEQLQTYLEKTEGGVRPFVYDYDDTGLDEYSKGVLDIWKNSANMYMYGSGENAPLYYKNLVNLWPATGSPYGLIMSGEYTAQSVYNLEKENASLKWNSWLVEVGLR